MLNLPAYLEKIGHDGPVSVSREVLESIHERHLSAIPFENIDVRLRRPILLDLDALENKLVARRRGGYCFEQNTLFAAVLRGLGFEVATLEARVRPPGRTSALARTHMLGRVTIEDEDWLVDVGFGGDGPLRPVPMDGSVSEQPGSMYRVVPEGPRYVLQDRRQGAWSDLYAFGLEPALPVDCEMANYYTSTHPQSIFVRSLTVQRSLASARHMLRGRSYTIRRGDHEEVHDLTSGDVVELVRGPLGLDVGESEVLDALGESS